MELSESAIGARGVNRQRSTCELARFAIRLGTRAVCVPARFPRSRSVVFARRNCALVNAPGSAPKAS